MVGIITNPLLFSKGESHFKSKTERLKRHHQQRSGERALQAEGTACAETRRLEGAGCI